jgi:hypothetical protein
LIKIAKMALTTLNLTVSLVVNSTCDNLVLQDITGNYSASNPFGYGSPNGIFINDVTVLVLTLNYTPLGVSAIYTFTILNGTIIAATINFNGYGAVNILTQLVNTTFPFTSANPFSFFKSYVNGSTTVTLPTIEDGAYLATYQIAGTADDGGAPTDFDQTTTKMTLMSCAVDCCINEAFSAVDVNCDCENDEAVKARTAKTYLYIAQYAVEDENSTRANLFINKAKEACDCDCGCH